MLICTQRLYCVSRGIIYQNFISLFTYSIPAVTVGDPCSKEEDCSLMADATCDVGGTNTCVCEAGYMDDQSGACHGKITVTY